MAKTDQEMLDKYKARIKRQNNAIKENYDRVSATLPLGTIDRIKALGLTINGVINDSVLAFLECAEESAEESPPQEHIQSAQNAEIKQERSETRKSTKEPEKSEIKANTTPQQDGKAEEEKMSELQAMIDEDKLKAMLNDKEFMSCVSNPIYKADFIKNYGICNYKRIQKCLHETEDEERENARKENIIMANSKN